MFRFLRRLKKKEANELEDCLAKNGGEYSSLELAEKDLFAERDKDLEELRTLDATYPELKLDFKATSLKRLESFYFRCYVDKKIKIHIPKQRFEHLMTQYMRQVFVHNQMAQWQVFENDFAEGRYYLGILYGYGSGTNEHYAEELDKKEDNAERTHLYDDFMLYVPEGKENEVL